MKRLFRIAGNVIGGIFIFAIPLSFIIFFFKDSFTIASYTPPNEPQMYFSKDPNSDDQYVLVRLNTDGTLMLKRSQTDIETYYADTTTVFKLYGSVMHPVFGNLYFKDHLVPPGVKIPIPFLGKPNTTAINAVLECVQVDAYNTENTNKVREKHYDTLYYSDDLFYMGSLKLDRVYEWPEEIFDVDNMREKLVNGLLLNYKTWSAGENPNELAQ